MGQLEKCFLCHSSFSKFQRSSNSPTMWPQIIGALIIIAGVSLFRASLRPKKFPPGPTNIPLIGSLLYVDVRNLSKSFSKLSKKYGDIFSLFVGRTPVVVINSYELIKSTFERMEFSGRPGNFSGTFFQKGKTGISTTEGKHWKAQREFLIGHLEHLTGAGPKALEDVVLDEVTDLKMGFAKKEGEALAISYKMNVGILNILWNLSCGRKLHAQQQEFQSVYECIDKITQFMSRAAIFSFLPILTKILPESITNMERGRYYRNRFHEISEKWIREHRQDYRGNRTGDLQDAYLDRINKGDETFSSEGLAAILREIFVIGSESESVMMRWAIRLLACYPIVLKKIQRFADIAPTGLLHKTVCDVSLGGFELPQGTLVMANLSACHRDPKYWTKPDQFYPEHFLTNGALVEDKPGFLPYGVGKRMCPGATLADMQIFLMISNILSEFNLTLPDGDKGDVGTQFKAGTAVLRNPKPYRIVINARE